MKSARKSPVKSPKSGKSGAKAKKTIGTEVTASKPKGRKPKPVESASGARMEFRLLVENLPALVHVAETGEDGKWLYVSPQIETMSGFSPEEWMANPKLWANQIHPEDRGRILTEERGLASTQPGDATHWEYRFIHRDGHIVWVEAEAVLVWEPLLKKYVWQGVFTDITARKEAEQALVQSEERFRSVFNTLPVSVWEEDFSLVKRALDELRSQGVTEFRKYFNDHPEFIQEAAGLVRVVDVNDESLRLFEVANKDDLLGDLRKSLLPDSLRGFSDGLIAIAEGKSFFEGSVTDRTQQGKILYLWRTMVFPKENAKFNSVLVSFTDITASGKAQEEINRLHSLLNAAFESTADGLLVVDADGKVTKYNRKFLELWRIPESLAAQKEDRSLLEYVLNQLKQPSEFLSKVEALYQSAESTSFDEIEFLDGRVFERYSQPERLSDSIIGRVWSFRDVTERKKTETILRHNEQRLRQVIDLVPHFIFAKDEEGKFVLVNQAVANAYGTTVEELTGRMDADFAQSEAEVKQFRADDMEVIKSGKPKFIAEEQITDSDGVARTLSTTKIPFTFSGTFSPAVLGVSVDITDQRQAETQLRESETRLLTVLEASPVPLTLNSMEDGVILYGNSALADILHLPLNEIIGQKAVNFYANPTDHRVMLAELERTGSLRDYEVQLCRSNGSVFWISLSSERIVLDGQTCLLSAFSEITERKRAETLQAAVYQISEAANKSSSLDELFRSVHATIGRVMPARNFYIALYDDVNDLLSFPYYVDEVDTSSSSIPAAKPGRGMTEYILRHGKPLLSDAANFEELARLGEVELMGPPSSIWIGAPLIVDGRTSGVIALQDYHDPKVYTERELRMLDYVSSQVAKAIERTRLHEDAQKKNRILSALQEATLPLISQTELSEVLQAILTQAAQLLNTTHGFIYLVESDEKAINLVLGTGAFSGNIGWKLKQNEGVVGRVWQSVQPLKVDDYNTWDGRLAKFEGIGIQAMLGVPLSSGSRVTGVLGLAHLELERRFSNEDVELLNRFAQLAAIAFENARLYTLNKQELAERKMTEEALREAEAKYRTVIEHISAITYTALMDERKTRLYVSPQIETLLGYTQAEYLADPDLWKNILHPQDRDRVLAGSKRLYETGEPFVSDYRSVARDGRVLWFHDEAIVYEDAATHKRFIQGIKVDITQRVQAEALQKVIYRISDATSTSTGINEFYRAVHDSLKGVMIAENFFIALYDQATNLLSFPYFVDEFDSTPQTAPLGRGPTGYVIRHGEPLLGKSETIQKLEESGVLIPTGTRSIDWLGVPLKIRNETIGVMVVQAYHEGVRYTQRDLDVLSFVSTQVASSIEHRRSQDALQASESRYRLSAQATNDVIWEWDLLANEEIWSENLYHLFGYSHDEVERNPVWWEKLIHPQDRQRVVDGLSAALQHAENIWEDEYRFLRKDGSYAYIMDRGYIERDPGGKPVRMIGAMSDITDRRRREEELEALASVSAALRVAGTRNEILQIVLDQIIRQFEARGAVLTLRRAGTDELVVEAAGGAWSEYLGIKAPVSGGVSRYVMDNGTPYFTNDLEKDSLISLNGMAKGSGSFISAPLSTPSGMIGALNIGRQAPFMPEDVRLVMNIADMAANAIQRASSYEQMRQQIDRIKVLRTIDMFIASGTDLHLTLQTIVNQAITHLGVDAVDILLLNQSVHALEFSEGVGFRSPGIAQTSLRVGEGFAGQAVLRREMVIVEDLASFENHPLFVQEGFIRYHGMPLIAKGDVKGVMEVFHRAPLGVDRDWLEFLESLAAQAALAMDNASLFNSLQRSNMELGMAYETTLEGWSAALDLRDKETEGHTQRVADLTLKLAEAMGLGDRERVQMRRGALLHDIGKMGIPDRILLKPDVLTAEEWEVMRQHPVYAYNLLHPIAHLRPALDIPYCHHERWDGSGYPRGLKEESIPLAARIFAVADVWDALCSDRPYRPAWARDKALSYIKSLAGVHFDPKVVDTFLRVVGEG